MTVSPSMADRWAGLSDRRAIGRWAWRSFRREWRQQALVLALLVAAVAVAVVAATVIYNTTGVREQARFGSANHRYEVVDFDLAELDSVVATAEGRLGPVDVIGRWTAPIPGSVDSVDYVAQDAGGSFAAPMLDLVDGAFPDTDDEVALTNGLEELLGSRLGEVVDLDGRSRTVVGIVENPSDLERDFLLVAPTDLEQADSVVLLAGGTGGFDEVDRIRDFASDELPEGDLTSRGDVDRGMAAAAVLGVAQVVLVLVCLVASAGFAAIAQRRLRQLGLLGALGATERHLTFVVVANGVVVGLVGATVGGAVGLLIWGFAAPALEEPVGYRIDVANAPWFLIAGTLLATVATAAAAAWLPARAAARSPIVEALAGRRPSAAPTAGSAGRVLAAVASGAALLFLSDGSQPLLFIVGTLLVVIGTLLLSPLALRALGALAAPFPVAIRIALRDLARSQGRSAVALAAVTLSLGIPVGIAIVAGVAEADDAFPNLPEDQVLIWTKDPTDPSGVSPFYSEDTADEGFAPYLPELDDRELDRLGAIVDRAAADVGGSAIPLEVVLDPKLRDAPEGRRAVVTVARRTDSGYLDVALLFRASPQLLNLHSGNGTGDIMTVAPRGPEDIVTDTSSLWLSNTSDPPAEVTSYDTLDPTFSSLPASFISDHAVRERSWDARTIGWLITAERPVTPEELTNLRDLGSREGFLVEAA